MKIDVLFFGGCPNHAPTVELVRDVVRELEVNAEVCEVEVKTEQEAESLRFLGSPTVQVEGVDIEPARRDDSIHAMSCRMYGASGVPPRELVVSALKERAA